METEHILLGGTKNTEEINKQPYFERIEIEGTPFTAIKEETQGWFLTMGNVRLTQPTETLKEQTDKIGEINWQFLTVTIATIVEKVIEAQKQN